MKTNIRVAAIIPWFLAAAICANSAEPSSATKVSAKLVFTTSIVWVGEQEPPEAESLKLLDAIRVFETNGVRAGIESLEAFLADNPQSQWSPSLHVHLAEHYRHIGRYSVAVTHWETAWNATKGHTDSASREWAGRAISGWTRLLASLGRLDQLDA